MKIIHFKIKESTFILRDQEILERNFHTRNYHIDTSSQVTYFMALVKLFFFLLFSGWKYDAYYIRFADWHTAMLAFFKRLYRKKLFIVIGGYDVAAIKRFNYGAHLNSFRSRSIRYSMNHATCLLPNSESMVYNENSFVQDEIVFGGIKHFAPDTRSRISVVHNGFDTQRFKRLPGIEKRNMAITVAVVEQERSYYMKGIDTYIQTARQLPSFEFLMVGISKDFMNRLDMDLPDNLSMLAYTNIDELIKLYSQSKVFCLFSLSEGMPNTLCEAMLCECVPVGTEVSSIPEIIGETGYVIQSREQSEITEKVKMAFNADHQQGIAARHRIESRYNLELREKEIVSILNGS